MNLLKKIFFFNFLKVTLADCDLYTAVKNYEGYPYYVSLITDGGLFCSGVLISEDLVLTAQACMDNFHEIDVIFNAVDLFQNNITTFLCTSCTIFQNSTCSFALIKLSKALDQQPLICLDIPEKVNYSEGLVIGFNTKDPEFLGQVKKNRVSFSRESSDNSLLVLDSTFNSFINLGSPLIIQKYGKSILSAVVIKEDNGVYYGLEIKTCIQWIHNQLD